MGTENETEMAMDLVCGMEINKKTAKFTSKYKGQTYYFCSENCKQHFDNDPEKYCA